jgi:hypothetical protein
MAARRFQIIEHPVFLLDLVPANFFLFPSVKSKLAGKTLKKEWDGAVRTLLAADFATAFSQWYDRCKKCVKIAGRYFDKS